MSHQGAEGIHLYRPAGRQLVAWERSPSHAVVGTLSRNGHARGSGVRWGVTYRLPDWPPGPLPEPPPIETPRLGVRYALRPPYTTENARKRSIWLVEAHR
jgi:hypothetical protein